MLPVTLKKHVYIYISMSRFSFTHLTNLTVNPLYGKAAMRARICFFCRDGQEDMNLLVMYLQAPSKIVWSVSTGVML